MPRHSLTNLPQSFANNTELCLLRYVTSKKGHISVNPSGGIVKTLPFHEGNPMSGSGRIIILFLNFLLNPQFIYI